MYSGLYHVKCILPFLFINVKQFSLLIKKTAGLSPAA